MGPFASAAIHGSHLDRKTLTQLISISQSKLAMEPDPDTSMCLRKAVLVQNVLRRNALVANQSSDSDDEDSMAVARASSVNSSIASTSAGGKSSVCKRLRLYRTISSDSWCESSDDEDDGDEAHVPDMLDSPRAPTPRLAQTSSAFVMMDITSTDAVQTPGNPFEVSPPPSPDALEGLQETEEEQFSKAMYAAEVARRAALVRKSSPCAQDSFSAPMLDVSLDELQLGAVPAKRPRIVYQPQPQQQLQYDSLSWVR